MNKIIDILKFSGCLLLLFVLPTLLYMMMLTNRQAGRISDASAAYQMLIFAVAAALLLVPFYYLYRSLKWSGGYFIEPREMPPAQRLLWSALYLALMLLVGTYGLDALGFLLDKPLAEPENQQALIEWTRHLPMAVVLADVVLFAPLVEEWLFRGALFGLFGRTLESVDGKAAALAVSSLLFGFMHTGFDWPPLIMYGLMGTVLSGAYLHFRDIRYPIAVHMANNAVAIASVYLSS